MSDKLVDIKDEYLSFFTPAGEVKALNGVSISLGEGEAACTCWGCDITYDYIKINGDYRT